MKIEIINTPENNRIPDVGELWKHADNDIVYMRVGDDALKCFLHIAGKDGYFASVAMYSGTLVYTETDVFLETIVILEPIEPLRVGNKLKAV